MKTNTPQSIELTFHDIEHLQMWGRLVEKSNWKWTKWDSRLYLKLEIIKKDLKKNETLSTPTKNT